MSLIKDGKIYRTSEEQLLHLTEKHLEQVSFNENVSKKLQELTVASNLGGYNIVRYAFSTGNSFKITNCSAVNASDLGRLDAGDFVVFNSFNPEDIPAYGFVKTDKTINLIFEGDYIEKRGTLICSKMGTTIGIDFNIEMSYGLATSLISLDANNHKKQVFTVLNDMNYNCKTQYVSYDVNGDNKYEFKYIGVDRKGEDGRSVYAANADDYFTVKNLIKTGDIIIAATDIPYIANDETKEYGVRAGDVLQYSYNDYFIFKGSIRGSKGEDGKNGINGINGDNGAPGPKGEDGKDGQSLDIKSALLNNEAELPLFDEANVGDAYRVINISGSVVSYDLYFKASDGTDWSIQPNWGGVPGPAGKDGVIITSATVDNDGRLFITLSNEKTINCGVVKGKDGINGINGENGSDGTQTLKFVKLMYGYASTLVIATLLLPYGVNIITYLNLISWLKSKGKDAVVTAYPAQGVANGFPVIGCHVTDDILYIDSVNGTSISSVSLPTSTSFSIEEYEK